MEEVAISLATKVDAKEISLLSRELIEYGLKWRYTEGRIKRLINHESKNVAVARTKSLLAGFGVMTYYEDSSNLDLLAVKTEFQGKGVAQKLVVWLEAVALNAGIRKIYVQARETNKQGVEFYKKLGYKKFAEKQQVYGIESQIRMFKKLC
ncbi:MAG: GNAT family N-acetyltransferase [Gammaproteobacteria bacterium]|nr:GNAT family N-acetyltransferase [Gammaproteobacteria bacterium]